MDTTPVQQRAELTYYLLKAGLTPRTVNKLQRHNRWQVESPLLGIKLLEISQPSDLSHIPDEEFLAIKGIGDGILADIRSVYPFTGPK